MKLLIKKDENGTHYMELNEFKDIVDIEKVEYYKLESIEGKGFTVEFYDKDMNILPTKEG